MLFQKLDPLKRFVHDIFVIWNGTRETLLQFLSPINRKDKRISVHVIHKITDSKISFRDFLLFKDCALSNLQYICVGRYKINLGTILFKLPEEICDLSRENVH